jgi:hypothetical protein
LVFGVAAPKEFQKTKPAALKRFGVSGYRINASVSGAMDLMVFIVSNMQRNTRRAKPMAEPLSPAAQAIWDAFNLDPPGVLADYGDSLAAAIRALVDQTVPADSLFCSIGKFNADLALEVVRNKQLAIAAELEGQANG